LRRGRAVHAPYPDSPTPEPHLWPRAPSSACCGSGPGRVLLFRSLVPARRRAAVTEKETLRVTVLTDQRLGGRRCPVTQSVAGGRFCGRGMILRRKHRSCITARATRADPGLARRRRSCRRVAGSARALRAARGACASVTRPRTAGTILCLHPTSQVFALYSPLRRVPGMPDSVSQQGLIG